MRLLLPPSEGKTAPAGGDPVDLAALSYAMELTRHRERLLAELERVAQGRPKRALELLGLSPGQAGELERNARLRDEPAAPAAKVYTGVLYERARLTDLPSAARARAERCVLIFSALWGVVGPQDRIPAYRFSSGARLPKAGVPAAFWRAPLARALADDGLIVDLRSGSYAAAWKPKAATVLAVRAFVEAADGSRKPISHMAKAARGDVARALLLAGDEAATPQDVAEIVRAAGLRAELVSANLDVIVPAV